MKRTIEKDQGLLLSGNELKKHRQRKRILNLLYKYNSLSAPVISKRLGVSLPTAFSLLNELIDLKWVEFQGTGDSIGGRKPALYGLSKDSIYVVSCELGRYKGKMCIFNAINQAVTPLVYFDTHIDDPELTEKVYQNALTLIREASIDLDKVQAIGLTMPGLVDEKKGINHTIKNKEFQNVRERLEKRFGKQVCINNDARMQAYGEYLFGKAKGHKNAIIICWSWGVGMGIIIDGKIYNGSDGFAGEFSHIKVVENGELCICGKRGCLETVASANVIYKNAIEGIQSLEKSKLTENFINEFEKLQLEDIINASKSGDEFSISLLNSAGSALGKGLSIVVQLLNPEIIVIGGPVSEAKQHILIPIQHSVHKNCIEQILTNTTFSISQNWENNGLLGINAMLFQHFFSSEEL